MIHDEAGQRASSNNESGPRRALKIRAETWAPHFIPDVTQQGVWKRGLRHSWRPALPCVRLSSKLTATLFLKLSCLTIMYDFKKPQTHKYMHYWDQFQTEKPSIFFYCRQGKVAVLAAICGWRLKRQWIVQIVTRFNTLVLHVSVSFPMW